jgi:hypothetical protein
MFTGPGGAGTMVVAPGLYTTFEQATADLAAYLQSLSVQATPVEQPSQTTVNGMKAMTAVYASQDQSGRVLHGRHMVLLTPNGTGLNIFAAGTPEQMPAIKAVIDQMAATVKSGPPEINQQAMAALAGTWLLYSGKYDGGSSATGTTSRSHEETVVFDGRGSFQYQSSSTVMVTTPGYTGDAGGASSSGDQGTYTVIGNTLVFRGSQGQLAVDFQLQGGQLTAGGKTYLRQ